MTILRMRASFGCLQNAELTLAPGTQCPHAPE